MSGEHLSWQKSWLALDDCRLGLLQRWCECQSKLENQAGWFELSLEERKDAEQASGLTDLDTVLRQIDRHLRRSLRLMPTGPSGSLEILQSNLRIAERLLPAEENSIVHGLISRAVRDLPRIQD